MESRKIVLMNIPTGQQWRCRHREQTDGRGGGRRREEKSLSRVRLFATPWTVAHQAPPSMGFSRREYWSELPFLSPGDLPHPGTEPGSPTLQADSSATELQGKP